jgi:hypothetical protein
MGTALLTRAHELPSEPIRMRRRRGQARAPFLLRRREGRRPEAFGVIYSGYSVRRVQGWHVHIVLLGNRWRKAWLYFVLAGKNLLQAAGLRKDDAPRV